MARTKSAKLSNSIKKFNLSGKREFSSVNINDGREEYIIYVAIPGMLRKDISLSISNDKLNVAVTKKEPLHCFVDDARQDHFQWKESFTLPKDADTLMTAAEYRNGELQIHIPKSNFAVPAYSTEIFVY